MIPTVLMFVALVLFILAAFDRNLGKVHSGWLGAATAALALLWPTIVA